MASSGSGETRPDLRRPEDPDDQEHSATLPRLEVDGWESGISHTETSLDGPTFVDGPRSMVATDAPRLEPDPGFAERYIADRILGQGGMGTVRLFFDRQIGRRVALKTIRDDKVELETRSRFIREARIQGQLEHPSVVPVYDLALDLADKPYFTMRRVRGLTLEEILERLAMGAPTAFREQHSRRRLLTTFSRVCLAVHYAHEHGVLHRDLKPANVILGEFGEVYVLDWGLAGLIDSDVEASRELQAVRRLTQQTLPGSLLGTPGYCSPEQALGHIGKLKRTSDVYALGAILFELLTLGPLHDGRSALARLHTTINGCEARPSIRAPEMRTDPELDRIVAKAVSPDPADRHRSALELSREIEDYLDGLRDDEERSRDARERAEAASAHADRALGHDEPLEARRNALRLAMSALAIDPGNAQAMSTVSRILTHPPQGQRPEIAAELAATRGRRLAWLGGMASIAYALAFVCIPFLAANHVTSWGPIVVSFTCLLAAALGCLLVSQAQRPSELVMTACMAVSNIGLAATAPLLGPLLVTPSLIAINTMPYTLYLGARGRWLSVGTALSLVAVTVALGLTGVIPGHYSFADGDLVVRSGALHLQPMATLALLTILAIGQVGVAALALLRARHDLNEAERALSVQAWLLRGMAPGSDEPDRDEADVRPR